MSQPTQAAPPAAPLRNRTSTPTRSRRRGAAGSTAGAATCPSSPDCATSTAAARRARPAPRAGLPPREGAPAQPTAARVGHRLRPRGRRAPRREPRECEDDPTTTEVIVQPGAAIDCRGNEIVVRHPRPVFVEQPARRARPASGDRRPGTVYLTLCYHEDLIDPSRPMLAGRCEPAPAASTVASWRPTASARPERPDAGPDCEPCCGACGDPCLELAAIHDFDPTKPLTPGPARPRRAAAAGAPRPRRDLGINWVHGATYTREDANALLDEGLELRFSRGVQVATLRPGVVELTGSRPAAGARPALRHRGRVRRPARRAATSTGSATAARPTRPCSTATG